MHDFSDYIIYVDESGDHSLTAINPEYPVFVLALCIFNKTVYANEITKQLQEFKFKYFGHDMVILHEHEIRKAKNDFRILTQANVRNNFMQDLNNLVLQSPFTIASVAIQKNLIHEKYADPSNPYHLALHSGLSIINDFLTSKKQNNKKTHIVFECRGKKEDRDLELEFRRICAQQNFNLEIIFADKRANSCGLQLADLVAHPIGKSVLHPEHSNRAFAIIKEKIYDNGGMKCLP